MPYRDLSQYKQSAQYLSVKGHRIAYWQVGTGEPLILIHGFPSAAWDWHAIWPQLSRQYQVVALDLLGFGLSDKPHPHHYSLLEQADIVQQLMDNLGLQDVHLLAHDYGDSVAQELLARQTDGGSVEYQSICFLNGGLFAESHRPLLTQKLLKSKLGPLIARFMGKRQLRSGFKKIFGAVTPPKPEEIDALWYLLGINHGRQVLPSLLRYIDERNEHRQRWVNAMQTTSTPLRFINGVQDPISGRHMLLRYQQLIDKADCVELDCGHYPQLEMPDEVLNAWLAFVN